MDSVVYLTYLLDEYCIAGYFQSICPLHLADFGVAQCFIFAINVYFTLSLLNFCEFMNNGENNRLYSILSESKH